MNQNRVIAIAVAAVLAVAALGYLGYRTFGNKDVLATSEQANLSKIEKELAVPGPLGDMSLGDPKAPIKVYEYASLTCSHCADFSMHTFPEFKKNYIDTGKVYYTLRDFPFDPIATAASPRSSSGRLCGQRWKHSRKSPNRVASQMNPLRPA